MPSTIPIGHAPVTSLTLEQKKKSSWQHNCPGSDSSTIDQGYPGFDATLSLAFCHGIKPESMLV
jgi:hypothetical protein